MESVFCIVGAMVGAGFASGREIMHFFSRYGKWSWLLILLSASFTVYLIIRVLKNDKHAFVTDDKMSRLRNAVFMLLLLSTGGAMVSAAGEVAAVTLPVHRARTTGAFLTLCFCAWAGSKSLRWLKGISAVLLPSLVLLQILALFIPGSGTLRPGLSWREAPGAVFSAIGYSGTNVVLAAQIIKEEGKGKSSRGQARLAFGTGTVMALLLAAENGALLPHRSEMTNAALPTVLLMRNYGLAGFYLSAAVLYLAVITTLIAVLRGAVAVLSEYVSGNAEWIAALAAASISLLGFKQVIASVYPVLGWAGILLLGLPSKHDPREAGSINGPASFHNTARG